MSERTSEKRVGIGHGGVAAASVALFGDCFLASGFLTFDDIRSLATACKDCRKGVAGYVRSLPSDIQRLIRHNGGSDAMRMNYLLLERDELNKDLARQRNPSPMFAFSFGSLALDGDDFRGDPWVEISVDNEQPFGLGTWGKQICAANDSGSRIFVCGGTRACKSTEGWAHFRTAYDSFRTSGVTAMFDAETGLWVKLPDMPSPRHAAAICRMGSKIYVLCGQEDTMFGLNDVMCFDLAKREWVDSGCQNFPRTDGLEGLQSDMVAARLDDSNILFAGGRALVQDGKDSGRVYALDITTGGWRRLADLPESMSDSKGRCQGFLSANGSFVFMKGVKWARLLPNGEWELMPGLLDHHIMIPQQCDCDPGEKGKATMKLFTGSKWRMLHLSSRNEDEKTGMEDWLICHAQVLKF